MRLKTISISILAATLYIATPNLSIASTPYTDSRQQASCLCSYVNPFIGTAGEGGCNPGAVVPNALMSVSPYNIEESALNPYGRNNRWCTSPYNNDNAYLTGFSHINFSGLERPAGAVLLTMPSMGEINPEDKGSTYSEEFAMPGYYSVRLDKDGIKAEMTSTLRTSIERYTFPKGKANIMIDLGEGLTGEQGATVRLVRPNEIEGMRLLGDGLGATTPLYYAIRISRTPKVSGAWKERTDTESIWRDELPTHQIYENISELGGDRIGWWFSFDTSDGEMVYLQTAISLVSCQNAWDNLNNEQEGFNFNKVRKNAEKSWEETLGRVRVDGGKEHYKTIFYTALYHANLLPCIINDHNGEYSINGKTYRMPGGIDRYSIFNLRSTSRGLHQLMTLLWPEKQEKMILSMLDHHSKTGWLPKDEILGHEYWDTPGDPATIVITDSFLKGIKGFDINNTYQILRQTANKSKTNPMRPGLSDYIYLGYIPYNTDATDLSKDISVSSALEYYIADNALSNLARALGHKIEAEDMRDRSLKYEQYYSVDAQVLRPLDRNKHFLTPFVPHLGDQYNASPGYYEGSAWTWAYNIPHDVQGMADMMGGNWRFTENLWSAWQHGLFSPFDIQSMLYPYIFSQFKGREWMTQEIINNVLENQLGTNAKGLPAHDRMGALSAWIVFSMMGFYPDCPGNDSYILTAPAFNNITINLSYNNRQTQLRIRKNFGKYVKNIKLSNKKSGYIISHKDLISSGLIEFKCAHVR